MKFRIIAAFFIFTSVSIFSQGKKYVTVEMNGLLATGSKLNLGFGIGYEEQITKHHGYVYGLNYRSLNSTLLVTTNSNNGYYIQAKENYLSIPIAYKFYSNIVNFTTGISFDGFLGGKYLTEIPGIQFGTYDIDTKFYVGWIFKIGKEISLTDKFILEPEIQYNPIFDYGYSYYGANIRLKYKL